MILRLLFSVTIFNINHATKTSESSQTNNNMYEQRSLLILRFGPSRRRSDRDDPT